MACCILGIVEALCPSAAADRDQSRSPSPSVARVLGNETSSHMFPRCTRCTHFLCINTRCSHPNIQCEKKIARLNESHIFAGSTFKSLKERFIPIVSSLNTLERIQCIYFGGTDNENRIRGGIRRYVLFLLAINALCPQ